MIFHHSGTIVFRNFFTVDLPANYFIPIIPEQLLNIKDGDPIA